MGRYERTGQTVTLKRDLNTAITRLTLPLRHDHIHTNAYVPVLKINAVKLICVALFSPS